PTDMQKSNEVEERKAKLLDRSTNFKYPGYLKLIEFVHDAARKDANGNTTPYAMEMYIENKESALITEASVIYTNLASSTAMWPDEVAHYSYIVGLGETFINESH